MRSPPRAAQLELVKAPVWVVKVDIELPSALRELTTVVISRVTMAEAKTVVRKTKKGRIIFWRRNILKMVEGGFERKDLKCVDGVVCGGWRKLY